MFIDWKINETYKDGRRSDVKIICTNRKGDYPLIGIVARYDGDEDVESYTLSGKHNIDCDSDYDLIPPEKSVYVVEEDNGDPFCTYACKDTAIDHYGKKSGTYKKIYRYVRKEQVN